MGNDTIYEPESKELVPGHTSIYRDRPHSFPDKKWFEEYIGQFPAPNIGPIKIVSKASDHEMGIVKLTYEMKIPIPYMEVKIVVD